jgi:hypothetical protein
MASLRVCLRTAGVVAVDGTALTVPQFVAGCFRPQPDDGTALGRQIYAQKAEEQCAGQNHLTEPHSKN